MSVKKEANINNQKTAPPKKDGLHLFIETLYATRPVILSMTESSNTTQDKDKK